MGSLADQIGSLGADIVGIAVTATFSQMAFSRELGIDFPLLSDWDGSVADAFGVRYSIWKGHEGVAKRAIFVVAANGTIAYRWSTDDAELLPDLMPMMRALETLA